jgi:UDP-N-acetylmuramoyl-tripeptide--D-alanyl-D-alanine ligase
MQLLRIVKKMTMTIEQLYTIYLQHSVICTDTRKIIPGCLFFALKGDRFNANAFATQAINAGAAYAVIDDETYKLNEKYILVDEVLQTLQQLARHHRKHLKIPFIGLTGTNGKTTTKELTKAVLSRKYKTWATLGNLNNHIGVPLTILSIQSDIELAIIEMGANHQKEIAFLSDIAQPDYGLITNIGKAHLEGFGGEEGVKIGKGELYDYLKNANKTALINRSNGVLQEMAKQRDMQSCIFYGDDAGLINGRLLENSPYLDIAWWENSRPENIYHVKTQLTGAYNFENILAAICFGVLLGIPPEQINEGLQAYVPQNNRSQIIKTAHNTIIGDYYNANPSSMLAALSNIDILKDDFKVIILGDMFELGEESFDQHRLIVDAALRIKSELRVFIGNEFYKHNAMGGGLYCKTVKEAQLILAQNRLNNAVILLKGSRGMALEELMSGL